MKKLLLISLVLGFTSCQFLLRKYMNIDKVGVYEKRSEVIDLLTEQRSEFTIPNSLVFRTDKYILNSPDSNGLLTSTVLIFDSIGQRRVLSKNKNYCSIDDIGNISDLEKIDIYQLQIADSIWPLTLVQFIESVVDSNGDSPTSIPLLDANSFFAFGFATFSARRNLKEFKEFEGKLPEKSHLILINRDIICEDSLSSNAYYCDMMQKAKANKMKK